jgi:ribosomal protein S18 acetylase RimI-like enzyme
MMNIDTFRTATPSDIEEIVKLVNAAYRTSATTAWTDEAHLVSGDRITVTQLADMLLKPALAVLVAVKNLTVVACVEVERQDNTSHIGMLAVNPQLQGKGIGKQMLDYAENYARFNFNADKFAMIVLAPRTEMIDFYLRRGYQKTGAVVDYPPFAGVGVPKQPNLKLEVLEKPAMMMGNTEENR